MTLRLYKSTSTIHFNMLYVLNRHYYIARRKKYRHVRNEKGLYLLLIDYIKI